MKTRFSDLLKVKKQKVADVEQQLQDVQSRKKRLEIKIEEIDREVTLFKVPTEGNFSTMQFSREAFQQLIQYKEELVEKLTIRKKQIEGLQELYKEATIEYEKIAYLDKEEIQKVVKKRLYEESKQLDEVANILFINKREKEEV